MLYTVTFNPAIDYLMHLDRLTPGSILRSERENAFFGGKGINVSQVLQQLGVENTALGFIAGFTGEALENGLSAAGVRTELIRLPHGMTRINVKLRADTETDINGRGPAVDGASLDRLLDKIRALTADDTLVLAGSVPGDLPRDIYDRILCCIEGRGVRVAVDTSGAPLRHCLRHAPFLLKPNTEELSELLGETIETPEEAAVGARRVQAMGAKNVLVSMGGIGAVLADESGICRFCPAVRGRAVDTTGAGDSMLAGFLAALSRGEGPVQALRLGTAAGAATAFTEGLADRAAIEQQLSAVCAASQKERIL